MIKARLINRFQFEYNRFFSLFAYCVEVNVSYYIGVSNGILVLHVIASEIIGDR